MRYFKGINVLSQSIEAKEGDRKREQEKTNKQQDKQIKLMWSLKEAYSLLVPTGKSTLDISRQLAGWWGALLHQVSYYWS